MIQIRQKKQNQRQAIRRQFLDNHFRELRKRYFNFRNDTPHNAISFVNQTLSVFEILLKESLKYNELPIKMRQGNLIYQLNFYVDAAIKDQNLEQTKFLLTVLANIFKENLTPDEKEVILRLSAKLFQSLKIANINTEIRLKEQHFQKVMKRLDGQTLIYYMVSANTISKYLLEEDQIRIQRNIYPAFINVLFYLLERPLKIHSIDDFIQDVHQFFIGIFDLDEADYQEGNRLKAIRNGQFFINIVREHCWLIQSNGKFHSSLVKVESLLFWLYDKLTDYFSDMQGFFKTKQLCTLIQQTLREQINQPKSKCLKYIYSILRTFVDENIFLKQIQFILTSKYGQEHAFGIQKMVKSVLHYQTSMYAAIELLYGISVSFYQNSDFKQILEQFGLKLIDMCVEILHESDQTFITKKKNRILIGRTLSIIHILMEKENVQSQIEQKQIVQRFQSQSGMKILSQIAYWFRQIDSSQDSEIQSILQEVQWILIQQLQTHFYE